MNLETRKKAYRALLNAEAQGGKHFPRVWVCGTHVFFTPAAAELQRREYAAFDGIAVGIEEVSYEEACQHDQRNHENWMQEVDFAIETAKFGMKSTGAKFKQGEANMSADPLKGKKEKKPTSKVANVIGSVLKVKKQSKK